MSDVGSLGFDVGSVLLGKAKALERTKSAVATLIVLKVSISQERRLRACLRFFSS